MATNQSFVGWPNYDEVMGKQDSEDVFSFPSQLPPLDFSDCSGLEAQYDFAIQETASNVVPSTDMLYYGPLYSTLDLETNHASLPGYFSCDDFGTVYGDWNEMSVAHETHQIQNPPLLLEYGNAEKKMEGEAKEKKVTRSREVKNSTNTKTLTRKTISQYFYMPITQAARQLNVGVTLLKKRCRELGIRRWPHRKLMSLQTLIKNVQELGKEEGDGKLREAIRILETERKLMEEIPDMQLEVKTKRLRQACFKANYKKRKLMANFEPKPAAVHLGTGSSCGGFNVDNGEDEDMKSVFFDCFPSVDVMF